MTNETKPQLSLTEDMLKLLTDDPLVLVGVYEATVAEDKSGGFIPTGIIIKEAFKASLATQYVSGTINREEYDEMVGSIVMAAAGQIRDAFDHLWPQIVSVVDNTIAACASDTAQR